MRKPRSRAPTTFKPPSSLSFREFSPADVDLVPERKAARNKKQPSKNAPRHSCAARPIPTPPAFSRPLAPHECLSEHADRARGVRVPAAGGAPPGPPGCAEHRPDESGGVLSELPVQVVPARRARARFAHELRRRARGCVRRAVRGLEEETPEQSLAGADGSVRVQRAPTRAAPEDGGLPAVAGAGRAGEARDETRAAREGVPLPMSAAPPRTK